MRLTFLSLGALLALAAPGLAAEAGLQQQVDALKAEIQYIRDNYERSGPVEIVKPVTEYVSPSGELFTAPQPGGVSPTDGSKLQERASYRKIKFNRRESVGDKIDSAIAAAMDGRVVVGMQLLGLYQNTVGVGDVVDANGQTRSANRGTGTGGLNINFSGKPMRNTLAFVDFDAASGSVGLGEAWLLVAGPKQVLSLQAGVVDLAGSFDANKAANDETAQFLSAIFVNSPLLMNPSGLGAILRADFSRWNLMLGTQDSKGASADIFDDLYWIAEAGLRYHLLGDAHVRVWARQQPRGDQQPDQALGVSYDHRLSTRLTLFGRYAKNSYVEVYDEASGTRSALNTLDWSASGGVELGNFARRHLNDKVGLAFGRTDKQGGPSEQYAEAYFKLHLTGNLSASLHGQGTLNETLPNQWTAGIRVLASY